MTIITGDCRNSMRAMEHESIDAIVTDPPYGLGFMGKGWDCGTPGVEFWTEAIRVLKPGGHLLAFGGTRTYHRLTCAIEDAGFEIRDQIVWLYGSGFPKGADIGKQIDKAAGTWRGKSSGVVSQNGSMSGGNYARVAMEPPATPEAQRWDGYRTALKPAWEPCIVARKPHKGPVYANCLKHGVGAYNVDACRIGFADGEESSSAARRASALKSGNAPMQDRVLGVDKAVEANAMGRMGRRGDPSVYMKVRESEALGRYPSNVVIDAEAGAALDDQSGLVKVGEHDDGASIMAGASRFFYCAKASRSEREAGLNSPSNRGSKPRLNIHPTVKPLDLMRYLIRLVRGPERGVILDPFCGSGTTGIAAALEGMDFVGCEISPEYAEIARARIAHWK